MQDTWVGAQEPPGACKFEVLSPCMERSQQNQARDPNFLEPPLRIGPKAVNGSVCRVGQERGPRPIAGQGETSYRK